MYNKDIKVMGLVIFFIFVFYIFINLPRKMMSGILGLLPYLYWLLILACVYGFICYTLYPAP